MSWTDLWKTHPIKIYEYLFGFVQIRGMSRTDLWKTHPTVNFRILGHDTDRKLIQNKANSRNIIFDEFRGVTQTDFWKTHPNLAHAPIFKKN